MGGNQQAQTPPLLCKAIEMLKQTKGRGRGKEKCERRGESGRWGSPGAPCGSHLPRAPHSRPRRRGRYILGNTPPSRPRHPPADWALRPCDVIKPQHFTRTPPRKNLINPGAGRASTAQLRSRACPRLRRNTIEAALVWFGFFFFPIFFLKKNKNKIKLQIALYFRGGGSAGASALFPRFTFFLLLLLLFTF